MKEWQFTVLFWVAMLGAMVMLFGKPIGLDVKPEVTTVFGVMLAFIYSQKQDKKEKNRNEKAETDKDKKGEEENG